MSKFATIKEHRLYRPGHARKFIGDQLGLVGRTPRPEQALRNVFEWIAASFDAGGDGGSSAYYAMGRGWKASYPETTGYLIPTMLDHARFTGEAAWSQRAMRAADWLLGIQLPGGGWQGLQVDVTCGPRVFNTGMILDGLVAAHAFSGDDRYLEAALRGAGWAMEQMDANGFFVENNVSGGGSFDTLVLACLLLVARSAGPRFPAEHLDRIRRALESYLALQRPNGWFERCNFHTSYPDTALLHHVGYTLDGLLICAEVLGERRCHDAVLRAAAKLLSRFEVDLQLPAYSKPDWSPYKDLGGGASLCLTGYSQLAIVFQKIARAEGDLRYLNAALKLNDIVGSIAHFRSADRGLRYGVPGAYPINGNYQRFQMVNWAAKYHAESLLLSLGHGRSLRVPA
ncbi:MAG: hypothetical protein JST66_16385 [Bacteroidetes bacterium]|nr:hypothetical protein [Bacteroidota bacterium]